MNSTDLELLQRIDIVTAMSHPDLFGSAFQGASWNNWRIALAAMFGLPLADAELCIYRAFTGRSQAPQKQVREFYGAIGRRGGKTNVIALVMSYLAAMKDYSAYLSPGERAVVLCISADIRQAAILHGYIRGLLVESPVLSQMIENETKSSIDLVNRVSIETHAANHRTLRGFSLAAVCLDELAFFSTDIGSDSPDKSILQSLRPATATIPHSMILGISSPYSKAGVLYEQHQRYYGKDQDEILVWQASSRDMNPNISEELVQNALEEDPESAKAEYLGQFRDDISGYITREGITSVVIPRRYSLPPQANVSYVAAADCAGGSADSMTLCIVHLEKGTIVQDLLVEQRAPYSPNEVIKDFSKILKEYHCRRVVADRYALNYPKDLFAKEGITYDQSAQPKSDCYRELLPLIQSQRVELLDHPRTISQFMNLERRTGRAGKDLITEGHSPDDCANAVALAVTTAAQKKQPNASQALAWATWHRGALLK